MFDELRGHIKRCPQYQIKARITIKLLSKAEVRNFNIKVIFFIRDQQDIFWLDIPMGNRLEMHIVKSQHYLMDNIGSLCLCEMGHFGESLE